MSSEPFEKLPEPLEGGVDVEFNCVGLDGDEGDYHCGHSTRIETPQGYPSLDEDGWLEIGTEFRWRCPKCEAPTFKLNGVMVAAKGT